GELTLGADVPDVRAKAHREPERDEHERRRFDGELAETVEAVDRRHEERIEGEQRVLSQRREQDEAGGDGEPRRDERREPLHPRRRREPRFKREPQLRPPWWRKGARRLAPRRRATCRTSTCRFPRRSYRASPAPARAGPWRAPRCDRRSRTARRALRRSRGPQRRRCGAR